MGTKRSLAASGVVGDAPATATAAATVSAPPVSSASGPACGRPWTVTVALPGSIVNNAQTHELRSHLVGQVARACAIFNVDEIVVFESESSPAAAATDARGRAPRVDSCIFMARLLQYLECPQYLRKHIFPVHPDLRCVGLLAPLDAPHHLRIDEPCAYREAVVVGSGGGAPGAPAADGNAGAADAAGPPELSSRVYTGLRKEMRIGQELPVGTRLTVRMPGANARAVAAVPPREPREAAGLYWGYEVRVAKGLSDVWSGCPYDGGYDLSVGTSEHGEMASSSSGRALELPRFRHLLIVFGGVEGLEPVVAAEEALQEFDGDVPSLFDYYLNLCPSQGSRTIRTEEALLVGLATLRPAIEAAAGASS